jgi:DNA-directed RNA polymerase specialized sigma24 family protein
MFDDGLGSITLWLRDLQAGDRAAAQPLWERYFNRLVRLARGRLRLKGGTSAAADEEDAALSAFESFCEGVDRGRFPDLGDRDDLWRLLVVITARKLLAQVRRDQRQKRGGGLVMAETDLPPAGSSAEARLLDQIIGPEPTPEFAAILAEDYCRLIDVLGDDSLRRVAVWRMEGYTNDEIASRLGCARRTVVRRLELIRATWLAAVP